MSTPLGLALTVILLAANAFFVGAEFALISSRRDRLETPPRQGARGARAVLAAMSDVTMMLAGAQLGITLCTIGLGALGEPAVAHALEPVIEALAIPESALHPFAFAVALALVVVLHILLGEMVPKNIAIAGPERCAVWLVPPLMTFVKVARPLIALYNIIANTTLRLLRIRPRDALDIAPTPGELAAVIAESRREGLLDEEETRRLTQALGSAGRRVSDVVVPAERLTTLPVTPTVDDVRRAVARTGFSRFPLRGPDGALTGYVHVKDVLDHIAEPAAVIPRHRVRALPVLAADARLDDALATMRGAGAHLARAIDTSGATVGLVALEDLVEQYVGTVRDSTHVRATASA